MMRIGERHLDEEGFGWLKRALLKRRDGAFFDEAGRIKLFRHGGAPSLRRLDALIR